MPVDAQRLEGPWLASCQFDASTDEFYGSHEEAVAWARRTPATRRFVWAGNQEVELSSHPDDAPPPPAVGPTVQVQGPDHDGRWVAIWFYRGEFRQSWGSRDAAIAWAVAQRADRRRISANGEAWRPLEG